MFESIQLLAPHTYDIIGVIGFGLYVLSYTLLTVEVLRAEHLTFFVLNWLAASFVLIGLMSSFNLASVLIQVFWIVVSTTGILMRLRRRKVAFSTWRTRGFTPTIG